MVVLNWNGWRDTLDCLASLEKSTYGDHEVVVVDNGSTDDSVARIREAYPEVVLLETGANRGFSHGNNAGIRHALTEDADHVWLLNNDTVVDPDALAALVDATDASVGAVGSVLYSSPERDEIQVYGGGWVRPWIGVSRALLSPEEEAKLQFVIGASLLIRREALEGVGLLDDGFFMYWEDADYGFRLREAGWKLTIASESRVWHKGSAVPSEKNPLHETYFNAGAVRFFRKHQRMSFVPILVGVGGRLVKRVLRRDWGRARAVWQGALAAWSKSA